METLICMLLLSSCGISMVLGLYALRGGVRPIVNKLFLLLCITLVIWIFGQAVAAGAQTGVFSTLGFRLSVVGWNLSSAAILTFLAEGSGNRSLLKKWWGIALLYLPPAAELVLYMVLAARGHSPELMVHTTWGWIPFISSRHIWLRIRLVHTLVFAGISLLFLIRWTLRIKSPSIRRRASVLILCFLLSLALGLTLEFLPLFAKIRIPKITGIAVLLPSLAVARLISRYHFLRPENADPDLVNLTRVSPTGIYVLFCIAAAVLSVLSIFLPLFFPSAQFSLPISLFLLAAAVYLLLIYLSPTDAADKEMWAALCFCVIIPVISLHTLHTGNQTMWAFVFIFIIGSLLSDRLLLLISVVISSLLTHLFIWYHQSVAFLVISPFTYLIRLLLLLTIGGISVYVHNIYVRQLRENAAHSARQALISDISLSFISADAENLDQKLLSALENCGRIIGCERANLILWEEEEKGIRYRGEWLAAGASSTLDALEQGLRNPNPPLRRHMISGEPSVIQDAHMLPPTASKIKQLLLAANIRAAMLIPLKKGDRFLGFFSFNAAYPMPKWSMEDSLFLQVIAGILLDAVQKLDAERKINFIAYHDQLTGLPNRLLFNSRLSQAIGSAQKTGVPLAVVFIDLDSFKLINDTMGHSAGDLLLKEVTRSLVMAAGEGNTVSRFGGDEFTVLIQAFSHEAELLSILDRLSDTLNKPFLLKAQPAFVTASMGVAIYPQDGTDAQTLIKNADASMYQAKAMGKNQYMICSQATKKEAADKARLSNLLYRAVEKNQLVLYYQPQINTQSGQIVGCEALLRWNLPDEGLIMPADFISLAEQSGLIHPIGEWVLETACRQNKRWHEMGFDKLRMAVNLSLQQLKNPDFVQLVNDILTRTGLDPHDLELEITESVADGSIINIVEVLTRLKALGISISIDDFGTEYSSLSRLKHLPIDRIKMDMQFVQGIDQDEKGQAISKVILSFAENLDLKVVAEGVETGTQKDFLSQRLCDEVQGFYYFHPLPADQAERVLRENLQP